MDTGIWLGARITLTPGYRFKAISWKIEENVLIPGRSKKLFHFSKVSISCLKPIVPHIPPGPGASSPRVDLPVREAEDLTYSMQGINLFTCLHGVQRDTCTFNSSWSLLKTQELCSTNNQLLTSHLIDLRGLQT